MARVWDNLLERVGLMKSISNRVNRAEPPETPASTTAVIPDEPNDSGMFSTPLESTYWDYYDDETKLSNHRRGLRMEYDEMDEECPSFSSALDVITDNVVGGDHENNEAVALEIVCGDPKALKELEALSRRLNLADMLWELTRDVAKYGERVEEVIIDDEFNICRLKPLPTDQVVPQYDDYRLFKDPAYKQIDKNGKTIAEFKRWQILHVMNRTSRKDVVGVGLGMGARKAFKQLRMMEEAVVVARLTRAHNRLAIGIDTQGMSPPEQIKHMNKVKAEMRKRRLLNARTGKMDNAFNPLSVEEDVLYAVGKDSKADVKVLQGDLTIGNIDDVLYYQQQIFTALKVPKAYLSNEKDTKVKGVMTEQDLQFARMVRRMQANIVRGIRELCDLQLRLKVLDPVKADYTIRFSKLSVIDELRKWQADQLKMLVARMFKQTFWVSDSWILTNMLGYTDDEAAAAIKTQVKPDKFNGLYQAPQVGAVGSPDSSAGPKESVMSPAEWALAIEKLPLEEQQALHTMVEMYRALLPEKTEQT